MDSPNATEPPDRFYRRHLPHWQPAAAVIFLTWRLHGSLPREALDRLNAERESLDRQPEHPGESSRDRTLRQSKGLFQAADRLLGREALGPRWLADDVIARLMTDALFHHHGRLYALLAFVVMPNHVHVLLVPLAKHSSGEASSHNAAPYPIPRITQALKGYVAREANRILGRTGLPFWQEESYDHWVRNDAEMARIVVYIEGDPVRSGLRGTPEEWRWSSAWERIHGRLSEAGNEFT